MVAELLAMDGLLSAGRLWPAATDGDPVGGFFWCLFFGWPMATGDFFGLFLFLGKGKATSNWGLIRYFFHHSMAAY